MGDLISRSDVIKALEECNLDKSLFEKDVFEKINAIPTSYDVEKVVAELEESSRPEIADDMDAFGDIPSIVVSLNTAIDIVRKGGIE
jgi:hypothetical protein